VWFWCVLRAGAFGLCSAVTTRGGEWSVPTGLSRASVSVHESGAHTGEASAIRARIVEVHGQAAGDAVRVLYGGSVKAGNIAGIMEKPDVDGALVGGASLQADEFGGVCRFYDMPVL
jgi:triosephosphate isomerase